MNKKNVIGKIWWLCGFLQLWMFSPIFPAQPDTTLQAFSHFGGWPGGSAIKGDYVFLIQARVLTVLDISGAAFRRVASLTLLDEPMDIVILGDYAFLVAASNGQAVQVVKIANPLAPELVYVADITTSWPVRAFAADNCLYIVSNDHLLILDVTNPAAPTLTSDVTIDPAFDIFVRRHLAYLAGENGLRILDITDPAQPKPIGLFPGEGATGVFVQGDYAYLECHQSSEPRLALTVVNVADSTGPILAGQINAEVGGWLSSANGGRITVAGNTAYIGAGKKLYVFDVLTPANPVLRGQLAHTEGQWAEFQSLQVIPPYAYAAMGSSDFGFVKIDVSNPEVPARAAALIEPWDVTHLFARGALLFLSSAEHLFAFDYADPENPVLAGLNDRWRELYRIYVHGNTLYGLNADTLHVIDVADPANMVEKDAWPLPAGTRPRGITANDSLACLVTITTDKSVSQFATLDVTNPADIRLAGSCEFAGEARDVFMPKEGATAYVAFNVNADSSGLVLIKIDDPTTPTLLGRGKTSGKPSCLWVADSLAFVGSNDKIGNWHIEVFNTANAAAPAQVGAISGPGGIADIEVSGQKVFASIQGGSMFEFDFIIDAWLVTLYFVSECHSPASIFFALMWIENMMLSCTCDGGWSFEELMASASYGVFLQNMLLYPLPVESEKPQAPLHFFLEQNYPNPFNPATLIKYTLPRTAQVKLEVFNALGERVAVLVDAQQSAGLHEINFSGEGLASGLYLYRLQAGDLVRQKKMLLLR